jgi:hypothetical protein
MWLNISDLTQDGQSVQEKDRRHRQVPSPAIGIGREASAAKGNRKLAPPPTSQRLADRVGDELLDLHAVLDAIQPNRVPK